MSVDSEQRLNFSFIMNVFIYTYNYNEYTKIKWTRETR